MALKRQKTVHMDTQKTKNKTKINLISTILGCPEIDFPTKTLHRPEADKPWLEPNRRFVSPKH
jgi:hypothetical protein